MREAALGSADEQETLAAAAEISAAFDRELDALLDGIEARAQSDTPPLVIERFDLKGALVAARDAAAARGGNADDACFDSETYRSSADAVRMGHPDCAALAPDAAPRFAEFVFWNAIHPTGAAHAELGAALIALTRRRAPGRALRSRNARD